MPGNNGNGFKKGEAWNGNRSGRRLGEVQKAFKAAIKQVEKQKKKKLMVHLIERAFADDSVLVAVGKKILPDKFDMGEGIEQIVIIRAPKTSTRKEDNENRTEAISG